MSTCPNYMMSTLRAPRSAVDLPTVRSLSAEQYRYADRIVRWDRSLPYFRPDLRPNVLVNPRDINRPDLCLLQIAARDLRRHRSTWDDTRMSPETIARWSRSALANGRPDIARSYFATNRPPFPADR